MNDKFWWLRQDWVQFKAPVNKGTRVLPLRLLEESSEVDIAELHFVFKSGRKDDRKLGNFSCWDSSLIFVDEAGVNVFRDMFMKNGKIHPVRSSDGPHFIVLIDTIMNAMDFERSEFERLDIYPDLVDDAVRTLKVVVRPGFTTSADIFRDGPKKIKYDLLVSDAFKNRYEQSGLTGLMFRDTHGG